VHIEVVEDQVNLALGIPRQLAHEGDQPLRTQATRVDHEAHLALAGHRSDP
jgi:hypothetical protein